MQTRFKQWMLLALFVPTLAMAQALNTDTTPAPAAGPVDADKQAAIKDLLTTIDADKLVGQIANGAQMQSKQFVPEILSDSLTQNKTLTDKQKQAAVPSLQQTTVPKLVADAGQVFQTEQFHKDAMQAQFDAYAKFYSTQELKDLNTFYRSTTGRKFIQVQDQVGHEIVGSLMQRYMPQSIQAIRAEADKEIAAVKPAAAAK